MNAYLEYGDLVSARVEDQSVMYCMALSEGESLARAVTYLTLNQSINSFSCRVILYRDKQYMQ